MIRIGRIVHFFREVDSTNEVAKGLAKRSEEGTVVIAETQTKGKGGLGRNWFSPPGGIWMSIILKPDLPPSESPVLNLIISLSVAKAISELGVEAKTRWPNDVVIKGKKVAGILAEADFNEHTNWVVVGIGIDTNVDPNSFPSDIRERTTSLKKELEREIDNHSLIQRIFRQIDIDYSRLRRGSLGELLHEWKSCSDMIDRSVEIKVQNEKLIGIPVDIETDGSLLIRTENGTVKRAIIGECTLVE